MISTIVPLSASMGRFRIISVDMFQTLVDVSSRRHEFWRILLGQRYSPSLADEYWILGDKLLAEHYANLTVGDRPFIYIKQLFAELYRDLFSRIGIDFNPERASEILAHQHTLSAVFPDANGFLTRVGNRYPICLSSDTDEDMLGPLRTLYPFKHIFTSEGIGAYKNDPKGQFFGSIVEHCKIEPSGILHIGDSSSDVLGSKRAGMVSCWLNRSGRAWRHDVVPDYEVETLTEVISILGL